MFMSMSPAGFEPQNEYLGWVSRNHSSGDYLLPLAVVWNFTVD